MYQLACAPIGRFIVLKIVIISTLAIKSNYSNKLNLHYFNNHCVFHWPIPISKQGSFNPNLKRGTFDYSKYLHSRDVTYFLFSGASVGKHKSIENVTQWLLTRNE